MDINTTVISVPKNVKGYQNLDFALYANAIGAMFPRNKATEKITLLEGDALEIMKTLAGAYDFIFMDAAKGQYVYYLPEAIRLLSEGGVLLSDNVLQDGDVIESRFAVERRNRPIHSRMREYLYELKHDERLLTSIVPLGDGIALSVKK